MKSGKIIKKGSLSTERVEELKQITNAIYAKSANESDQATKDVIDTNYRKGLCRLPTNVLEDIIKSHKEGWTKRYDSTLFAIQDELANRVLISTEHDNDQ